MKLSNGYIGSALCAYLGVQAGFLYDESWMYFDSRATGATSFVWQNLFLLLVSFYTHARMYLGFGTASLLAAAFALWLSRRRWFRSARLPGAVFFSVCIGPALGALCSILIWALAGGWGPSDVFTLIGLITGALLGACIFDRRETQPSPAPSA